MAPTGWSVQSKERLTKRPISWMPLWASANRHTFSEEDTGDQS
jgi:hypothetical protein